MKAYVLQFISVPLVFVRYDIPSITSKIVKRLKNRNARFRGGIAWNHFESIFDPQHPYNTD